MFQDEVRAGRMIEEALQVSARGRIDKMRSKGIEDLQARGPIRIPVDSDVHALMVIDSSQAK
jgi:hypothetical protein